MERCDVLIVGGGPAGSTLARELRRRGTDVALLDRARFPRDKVCAGWITPAVTRQLQLDLEHYRIGRTLQPVHGFLVGIQGQSPVCTARSAHPLSHAIRRTEFDHYLLARSGARRFTGRSLTALERDASGWVVNGELHARMVVGAGGHFCPVARMLRLGAPRAESLVAAQEIEFDLTPRQAALCPVDPETPELYFCDDLAGYGWLVRKGDRLNVGLGREDPRDLPAQVSRFRRDLVQQGRLPAAAPARWCGHAYRLYPGSPCKSAGDAALLVGDAAGLAHARSGEGIGPAVESSLLASQVIAAAAGDYRRERLAPYDDALIDHFGRRDRGPGAARLLSPAMRRALARRLLRREWFGRRVVIDRWFLRRHIPPVP